MDLLLRSVLSRMACAPDVLQLLPLAASVESGEGGGARPVAEVVLDIARAAHGFSLADLQDVCREAGMLSLSRARALFLSLSLSLSHSLTCRTCAGKQACALFADT